MTATFDYRQARELLLGGRLHVTIENTHDVRVVFDFTPCTPGKDNVWPGDRWWLRSKEHYIGIVTRAGQRFELTFTGKSTHDAVVVFAARKMLAALGDQADQVGYTLFFGSEPEGES